MRGNPHAAFDVAGAGNVAWSRWCDTRRRKGETTGNTNFDLNRRASPRPYLGAPGGEIPPGDSTLADIGSLPSDVRFWGKADIAPVSTYHLRLSSSRKAIASSSTRTASSMGMTGRASKTKAGSIEQNL